jgi:hypothetical protein
MNPLLGNTDTVRSRFDQDDVSWLAVRDDNNDPFFLFVSFGGDLVYVGIPVATDEDGTDVDQNRGVLSDDLPSGSAPTFPLVEIGSY